MATRRNLQVSSRALAADPTMLLSPDCCDYYLYSIARLGSEAVIDLERPHQNKPSRQQPLPRNMAIKFAGAFEIRRGQENIRDAVDFHRLPLRHQTDFRIRNLTADRRQHTAIRPGHGAASCDRSPQRHDAAANSPQR